MSEYSRAYYAANKHRWARDTEDKKERHRVLVKESYIRHKERRSRKRDEWAENNHARVLFLQTRRRAKQDEIHWDLQPEDIVIPTYCPYLGSLLTSTQGQGVVWTNASVDRIDNSKGYVKENIEVISRLANSMKQHATQEQLINFAKRVLLVNSS